MVFSLVLPCIHKHIVKRNPSEGEGGRAVAPGTRARAKYAGKEEENCGRGDTDTRLTAKSGARAQIDGRGAGAGPPGVLLLLLVTLRACGRFFASRARAPLGLNFA